MDSTDEILKRVEADLDGLEKTSEDDRVWFESNPDRNLRLREPTEHERATGTHRDQVLVCQLQDGVRTRLPIIATGIGDLSEVPEAYCWAIFEYITSLPDTGEIRTHVRREMSKRCSAKTWKWLEKKNPIRKRVMDQAKRETKH